MQNTPAQTSVYMIMIKWSKKKKKEKYNITEYTIRHHCKKNKYISSSHVSTLLYVLELQEKRF